MNKVCPSCQQMFDETLAKCPYCGMPNENSVAESIPIQEVNPNSMNVESQSPSPNNVIPEPNVPTNNEPQVESIIQPVVPNPEVIEQVASPQPVPAPESINNQSANNGQLPVQEVNLNSLNVEPQSPSLNDVILGPNVPTSIEPQVESVIQPAVPNSEIIQQVVSPQPVPAPESVNNQSVNSEQPPEIVKSDTVLIPTNIMQEISVDDLGETELDNANLEVVSSNAPTESLNVEEKKIELPPMPDALIEDVDASILGNKYESEEEANNQRLLEKQRIEAEKRRIENEKREQELAKKMQVKPDLLRIDNPTPPPDQIATMPDKKKKKKLIIIIAICLIVIIIAVLAIWLLTK